ncbi:hypothetical protein [Streptomyces venezuelae]|uniref:Uncharacterized protein n=1 Tax=Streptomyces venezuelae TaxID=54571 RepID=A0A5P2B188_STRVZ|nr:hypothetical protein [Streptomyces venezuelae]QES24205.1 hypothetical protein DEJ46_38125 [Streptomyces venezuelae]
MPHARGGTARPYKDPNIRAVKEAGWITVTCPSLRRPPRHLLHRPHPKATIVEAAIPHQERPPVIRRALAAMTARKKLEKQ